MVTDNLFPSLFMLTCSSRDAAVAMPCGRSAAAKQNRQSATHPLFRGQQLLSEAPLKFNTASKVPPRAYLKMTNIERSVLISDIFLQALHNKQKSAALTSYSSHHMFIYTAKHQQRRA